MSNLWIKLDALYADNPKIMAAGPEAELLYVRALCKAKQLLSDGVILEGHLARIGIAGYTALATRLVEVGLWECVEGGWHIVGWHERNASAAEIIGERSVRSTAGTLGNHRRWHQRKTDPNCPHCQAGDRPKGHSRKRGPIEVSEQ